MIPEAALPAALVGLAGGLLVGLTGIGAGSVISTLLLVTYPGVAPRIVVGSATLQAVVMKLAGVLARRQFRMHETRLGVAMAAGAAPLGVAGAFASHHVPGQALKALLAWVLVSVGVLLVIQALRRRGQGHVPDRDRGEDPTPIRVGLSGSLVGFVAGMTSIGTGTLFVSTLAGPLRVGAHRAVAAALVAGTITLLVSGVTHAALGHAEPMIVAGACVGSVPGVVLGTALSHRLPARALRGVIGAGIAAAAAVTLTRLGR